MTAYYNEFEPFAAQWLKNLSDAGHIKAVMQSLDNANR